MSTIKKKKTYSNLIGAFYANGENLFSEDEVQRQNSNNSSLKTNSLKLMKKDSKVLKF
jgi:hypothetical protein